MAISVHTTADRSHTLYNEELDETYHSRNGAVEESLYVFLRQGFALKAGLQQPLRILEVGFGTGLNALLTLIACEEQHVQVHYHSLETYPLPGQLMDALNYTDFVSPAYKALFGALHRADWDRPVPVTERFVLEKIHRSIHEYVPAGTFDLVYFDAFGPGKQPDMWTQQVFDRLFAAMVPSGILVTYSSKGDVKRALRQAGFTVERLPGPPRKRHMLRAVKP